MNSIVRSCTKSTTYLLLLVLYSAIRSTNSAYIFGYLLHNPIPDESSAFKLLFDQKMAADEPSSSNSGSEPVTSLPQPFLTRDVAGMLQDQQMQVIASTSESPLESSSQHLKHKSTHRRAKEPLAAAAAGDASREEAVTASNPVAKKRSKKRRFGQRSRISATSASPKVKKGRITDKEAERRDEHIIS